MTETAEESQVLVQAGTATTDPGNEEVSTQDHKSVSPMIDAETPFKLSPQEFEFIRIDSIENGLLMIFADPIERGRFKVVLSGRKNGAEYEMTTEFRHGRFETTGHILPRGTV